MIIQPASKHTLAVDMLIDIATFDVGREAWQVKRLSRCERDLGTSSRPFLLGRAIFLLLWPRLRVKTESHSPLTKHESTWWMLMKPASLCTNGDRGDGNQTENSLPDRKILSGTKQTRLTANRSVLLLADPPMDRAKIFGAFKCSIGRPTQRVSCPAKSWALSRHMPCVKNHCIYTGASREPEASPSADPPTI